MKYPCNIIQDLLPLYHDKVCSEESRRAVQQHLPECEACRDYLAALDRPDAAFASPEETSEEQKAASFRSFHQRIEKKQRLFAAACGAAVLLAVLLATGILRTFTKTVVCDDNLSVSMAENGLVCRLSGSVWDRCRSVTVTADQSGDNRTYLFFCLTDNLWDDLITGPGSFSEYTLCPADKGADAIDQVRYYTGDYSTLSSMDPKALEQAMKDSVLLWSK